MSGTLRLLAAVQTLIQHLPRDAQEPRSDALIAVGAVQRLGEQRPLSLFERWEPLGKTRGEQR